MSASTAQPVDLDLLNEVKSILRRDLKLGPDARIADDMPLIGGDMDLDSLDILLVISSIEKHFKIKIPNEVVGRWVFQDVTTLTRFVQENRNANADGAKPHAASAGAPSAASTHSSVTSRVPALVCANAAHPAGSGW